MSVLNHQKKICKKFGLSYEPCDMEQYFYITEDFSEKKLPIEGKRYIQEDDFSGWYIWSGENPKNNDVFKKVPLSEFARSRTKGKIALELIEGDHLVGVDITDGQQAVLLMTDAGKAIHFHENDANTQFFFMFPVNQQEHVTKQSVFTRTLACQNRAVLYVFFACPNVSIFTRHL